MTVSNEQLAKMIDHTQLKPTATLRDIEAVCDEALLLNVATVCVNPFWVSLVAQRLAGSSVKPITVVGFPLGSTTSKQKAEEARSSVEAGAAEIDMVLNVGAYLSGQEPAVRADIAQVVEASGKAPVKVILETAYLTQEQIYEVTQWCAAEGAAFVKTSTGFATRGASVEDIQTMKRSLQDAHCLERLGIKASGGIRDYATAMAMIEAGATRIGASASAAILGAATADGDRQSNY